MYELSIALIIAALACTLLLIYVLKQNKNVPEKKPEKVTMATATAMPKPKPKPVKETKVETAKKSRVYEDPTRDIDSIYRYSRFKDFWVCPDCEAENPISAYNCCLCHKKR